MMTLYDWFLVGAAAAAGVAFCAMIAQGAPYRASSLSAGYLCAELQGAGFVPGIQRGGHTLRSISCSGSVGSFNIHVVID